MFVLNLNVGFEKAGKRCSGLCHSSLLNTTELEKCSYEKSKGLQDLDFCFMIN